MLDFLFSPFKAIYSLDTYIKAIKQSAWKTLLFLVYLLVLFSLLFFAAVMIKTPPLTPFFKQITEQVAQVVPEISVKDGKLSANNDEYYEIDPIQLMGAEAANKIYENPNANIEGIEQKIVFDTGRTEPVYPTQLKQEKIGVLITDKVAYVLQNNRMEAYEYNFDKKTDIKIDGKYIMDNEPTIVGFMNRFVKLVMLISVPFVVGFFMVFFIILAIIAVAISQLFARAEISFGDVCSISCYLLAPILFFVFITFLLPFNIPLHGLICFIILIIYGQFILNRIKYQQNTNKE